MAAAAPSREEKKRSGLRRGPCGAIGRRTAHARDGVGVSVGGARHPHAAMERTGSTKMRLVSHTCSQPDV